MNLLVFLFEFVLAQRRTATIGTPCSPTDGDVSACQDNMFLECERETAVWVRQNQCATSCFEDPIFASNCFKVAISPSPTPVTTRPAQSTVAPVISNTASGIPMGGIIGIVLSFVFILACALLFAYWMYARRQKSKQNNQSILERKPTGANNVLEKRYIATLDYQPTASDEVKLQVGDIVILDLLFNDGWAKVNKTNVG
jgi:hypothetical protein